MIANRGIGHLWRLPEYEPLAPLDVALVQESISVVRVQPQKRSECGGRAVACH